MEALGHLLLARGEVLQGLLLDGPGHRVPAPAQARVPVAVEHQQAGRATLATDARRIPFPKNAISPHSPPVRTRPTTAP